MDQRGLDWVKADVADALKQAQIGLEEFAANPSETPALERYRASVAKAGGVLAVLGLHGASLLAKELEAAADTLAHAGGEDPTDVQVVLMQGVLKLRTYLQRIDTGQADTAFVLLPFINHIRAALGRSEFSEQDVFNPDLTPQPSPAHLSRPPPQDLRAYARKLRGFYHRALVDWMRGAETGPAQLDKVISDLVARLGHTPWGRQWQVAGALVEALQDQGLSVNDGVKSLLREADQQLRRLSEGGGSVLEDVAPERLMKGLLYHVGRARSNGARTQHIKAAYQLAQWLPEQEEIARAQEDLAGPDCDAVSAVGALLHEKLGQVKEWLDRYARHDPDSIHTLATIADALQQMSSILATLGLTREQALLQQRAETLNHLARQKLEPTPELLINLADELLVLESSTDALARHGILRRTTEPGSHSAEESDIAAAQYDPMLGSVDEVRTLMAREGQANLAKVKECITAFVAQPTDTQVLAEAPRLLRQVEGGLAMAGLMDASAIVKRFAGQFAAIISEPSSAHDAQMCDTLAETVIHLEDYLDAVVNDRELPHLLEAAASKIAQLPGAERPISNGNEVDTQQVSEVPCSPRKKAEATETQVSPKTQPPADVDEEVAEIFAEEAEEVLTTLRDNVPRWKAHTDDHEALTVVRRSFHTLKGSGRLVGATSVGEFGWALENMLNQVLEGTVKPTPDLLALLETSLPALSALVEEFKGGAPAEIDLQSLIDQANALSNGKGTAPDWSRQQGTASTPMPTARPDGGEGDAASMSLPAMTPQAQEQAAGEQSSTTGKADPVLMGLFLEEASGHVATLRRSIGDCELPSEGALAEEPVLRSLHTLRGNARVAGVQPVLEISHALEHACQRLHEAQAPAPPHLMGLFRDAVQRIEEILDALRKGQTALPKVGDLVSAIMDGSPQPLTADVPGEVETVVSEEEANDAPELAHTKGRDDAAHDRVVEHDEALVELFLEEANELLDTTETLIEQWRSNPTDRIAVQELQRQLHTLKGGARMANMTPMGDLSHAVETVLSALTDERISATDALVERVQHAQDQLMQMLEQARHREVMAPADALMEGLHRLVGAQSGGAQEAKRIPVSQDTAPEADPESPPGTGAEVPTPRDAQPTEPKPTVDLSSRQEAMSHRRQNDQVRVDFPLLEKLANLAGEASINRSRLGQQIGAMHFSLGEMDETVGRLREQLRRMEMETESQVLFRYEQTVEGGHQDFDPLELDRYSQVQQLSRSLMESTSDLSNIQDLLDNLVSECETSLIQQARIGTELQQGLMQMRMVPFAGLVPRLRHIVRQTARELGKKVELKVTGANTELDRGVLNRISGPLEHMLRNAIDHGIEPTEVRSNRGKPEQGTIALSARYESAEVVLEIRDDGAGLNLERIRSTAQKRGLLPPDSALSDKELMQFILEPAFSTARQVSQVSGRGVGMDVVNTEIKQLNGTLEIDSVPEQGTTFAIRLPLTLSVTQALMVDAGEEQLAVPINGLEAVTRVPQEELASAYQTQRPELSYQGMGYRLCHLGQLLGCGQPEWSTSGKPLPVLLVRTGQHRTAFQVDGLNLSQEVVVKAAGPLLASVPWLAGATILADGSVVLILDMPALVRMSEATGPAGEAMGQGRGEPRADSKDRVPIILVVDDSITVRKVTTRLLESHGMRVLTARDGVDAVSLLQEQRPDMMLLDVEMPRMDGYELATQVRNDDRLKHLPIIMITSRTATKHRERARQIGVDQYLGKPYSEQELLGGIRDALEQRQ
jgi:chemosensory pili system protein ChpA (sensor histidine kinase/response regulator)